MKRLSVKEKKWIERTVANNRSYKSFLYNRFFIFLLLSLAQICGFGLFIYLLVYHSTWGVLLQTLSTVSAVAFVVYIINTHEKPSLRLNWIIVILIAPVFGVPTYLIAGRGVATKKLRKAIDGARKDALQALERVYGQIPEPQGRNRLDGVSALLYRTTRYPAYESGTVDYFDSGEGIFPVMLEELKKARSFILVEYFIIAYGKMWNEIWKLLLEKAKQGVKIRILYDDFGCMMNLPPKYDAYLESLHENIKCTRFNKIAPVFTVRVNNRDHRKILVIDNAVAFTGGFNLADEYIGEKKRFGYWKDAGVKITGDAVRSFTQTFFTLWNASRKDKERVEEYLLPCVSAPVAGMRIHPYDDSPLDKVSMGESVYTDVIESAERYVYVFTPYLILDDFMRASLCKASLRGVDVRIVTPAVPDKKTVFRLTRANYGVLLQAGVKIYEYTPGFIHAKCMVSDDRCAVVGTINLDYRSLYHHFENAVYFSGCEAVIAVKKDAEHVFAVSKPRTLENTKRGLFGRLSDSILRVFETLL